VEEGFELRNVEQAVLSWELENCLATNRVLVADSRSQQMCAVTQPRVFVRTDRLLMEKFDALVAAHSMAAAGETDTRL